jgi:hypothetical protein
MSGVLWIFLALAATALLLLVGVTAGRVVVSRRHHGKTGGPPLARMADGPTSPRPTSPPPTTPPPVLIDGRFQIERLVQRGGMGVVYRALDRQTREPVALKLLLREGAGPAADERFAREARVLAGLRHPRIARHVAHGRAGSDGSDAYLAMQWLDGEDLAAVLARGPLSLAGSLQVLRGAAEALAAVHAQGVVHRDLKPGNIFLRGNSPDDVVLLDFGLARTLLGETRLTRSAALVGTPHYMAPEQAASDPVVSPATDVFALGCVFHECLVGQPAFGGAQLIGVLARILFDPPEPVRQRRPSVPQSWADLLIRMLAKRPTDRPADARTLLDALAALDPPPPEPAPDVTLAAAAPAPSSDGGDQVLVSVVLASPPRGAGPGAEPPGGYESVRAALERLRCPVDRLLDGSLLATVLPPHGATDQARIAARCALHLRELWPSARVAVTTGRGSLDRRSRVGDAVDRAARLMDSVVGEDVEGPGVAIRLDALTAGLLDARFVTTTRGGETLLLREDPDLDETRPLLGKPTPCVGRQVELDQLEGLMASVVDDGQPRAAVVVGPPGIGKSRLRHELMRRLEARYPDLTTLMGYGDPLNAGSPYVIIGHALRRGAGIGLGDDPATARARLEALCAPVEPAERRRVSEFLGELCGVPFPAEDSPPLRAARGDERVMEEQIGLAFVDWLTAVCANRPVLLVLEDLQWGDALSVKLLDVALRELGRGALLVLALARPEVEQAFPRLLADHRALSLSLRPLSGKASALLVQGVLGQAIGEGPLSRVVELAGGNALFLEELIRAAAEGQAGDVPPTVVAMLQARLSRLPADARQVLRAGAVFGETFWQGAVVQVCAGWNIRPDAPACLRQLVDEEILSRRRSSRFPGETEYAVRHQLVCEAAAGLSTEVDARAAHRAAGRWLEAQGGVDAIVLARHADEGGEPARAVSFYVRAAEQSITRNDFHQALARAERGMACGAAGQELGILRSVRASALYSLARWMEAAEVGLAALPLLPAGGAWWSVTLEKLFQVLPNNGDLVRYQQLADEMLRTPPLPGARDAFLRALHVQLLAYAISGQYARGRTCLDFIDRLEDEADRQDVVALGYARLWRAVFTFILGTDIPLVLRLIEEAERDLAESRVIYRLSLAHCLHAFALWGIGDLAASEQVARRARAAAQEIGDHYQTTQSTWYLGLALCEQTDPGKREEAEDCARAVMASRINPIYEEGIPRVIIARVAVGRGDWVRAESEARRARSCLDAITPFQIIASADLMTALVQLGRGQEAAAIAREDRPRVDQVGGSMCTEVMFNVSAAQALLAAGDGEAGGHHLRLALDQIERRAALMTDPAMRASYLGRREENRRAFALRDGGLATG